MVPQSSSPRTGSLPDLPVMGVAFLVSQLGAHTSCRFADQVGELGLTGAQAGLLRLVAAGPGRSQQAIAAELGALPSKVVMLVDELESRGMVERRRNQLDRRNYALYLTEFGQCILVRVAEVVQRHEAELTAALSREESRQLTDLLRRVADQQGLTRAMHPAYCSLR